MVFSAPIKDITIDQVKESVKFKRHYGKENDIEDLDWTMRLLENSSNEDLLEKCIEHKMSIDPLEIGGPIFFFIMKGLIQQNTQECVQSLVAWVTDMKLTDLPGKMFMKRQV